MTPKRRAEIIRQLKGVTSLQELAGFHWSLTLDGEHRDSDVMAAYLKRKGEVT